QLHPVAGRHSFPEGGGPPVDEDVGATLQLAQKPPRHAPAPAQHVGKHPAVLLRGDHKAEERSGTHHWLARAHMIASKKSQVKGLLEFIPRGAAPPGHAIGALPARNWEA